MKNLETKFYLHEHLPNFYEDSVNFGIKIYSLRLRMDLAPECLAFCFILFCDFLWRQQEDLTGQFAGTRWE